MDRDEMSDYNRGWHDGFDDGFASADDWYVEHEAELEKHGFIKLPVDADGVPIRVGDVMDETVPPVGAITAPVDTMELYRGTKGYGWLVKLDTDSRGLIGPKLLRHHRTPTVEDVLREFGEKLGENKGMYISNVWDMDEWCAADRDTIAEYAAKLRLAGDE